MVLPCARLQDGGDPDLAVSPRDIVYTLDAAEAAAAAAKGTGAAPSVLATTDLRCGGVSWGDGEELCWLIDLLHVVVVVGHPCPHNCQLIVSLALTTHSVSASVC